MAALEIEKEKDWTKEYFKARGFELAEISYNNRKISFYSVRKKEKK